MKARAFRAGNGELGILPADGASFLAACRSDGVGVLGWELWIVNYACDFNTKRPVRAEGLRCGCIPVTNGDVPSIIGGEGDADEIARQLAASDLNEDLQAAWLPHLRVNFTLDG